MAARARSDIPRIRVDGMVAYVPLTKGCEAIIDLDDIRFVAGRFWHVCLSPYANYAVTVVWCGGRRVASTPMHRHIMQAPAEVQVDHINGDGLDNRRTNLRLASPAENSRNRGRFRTNTSGYPGVVWNKKAGKWQAQVQVRGRSSYLGLFESKEEAAAAYQAKAREMYGAFYREAEGRS